MNEFDKWWNNNITEINKRYEDGTLQEFIYLAGAAAMREKCAEEAVKTNKHLQSPISAYNHGPIVSLECSECKTIQLVTKINRSVKQ